MSLLLRDEPTAVLNRSCADGTVADDDLLRRFVADRCDLAFGQLVTRHGPLVMSVCRRVLAVEQDAEDAFQATFMVLARKAQSVRRGRSLPAWLHKTAYRVALRARAAKARRRELPLEAEAMIAPETLSQLAADYDQSTLDEELNRLPEKYRLPLFLCCVEGVSRDEAAHRLGWSLGSLKGRLERGRQLLRQRLLLRGVSLAVALAVFVRSQQAVQAAVSPSLIVSTVQAGVQYAAGQSVLGYVTQNALSLANGSLQVMSLTTSKVVLSSLMGIGLAVWGASWLPAPAVADVHESGGRILTVEAETVAPTPLSTFVAFAPDDERNGRRSPEAETGSRRSPEAEAGQRRSPQAEAGQRRSPEAEAGQRRSPEAEAGPRRSPEAEAGPRTSAEGNLGGFRPQTQREAALYQMIQQLQREVAALRREVGQGRGGDAPARTPERGGERPAAATSPDGGTSAAPANWERSKEGGVFKAYDKNGDLTVTLDEWLKMKPGSETDPARRQLETTRFNAAEPSGDGKFTVREFLYWYTVGRFQDTREGRSARPRDGEGETARGPRDPG